MVSKWLEMPKVTFLLTAMIQGATLLEDSVDDFRRETTLLCYFQCKPSRNSCVTSSVGTLTLVTR
jgi:hypothetical protein